MDSDSVPQPLEMPVQKGARQVAVLWSFLGPAIVRQVQSGIESGLRFSQVAISHHNIMASSPDAMRQESRPFLQKLLQDRGTVGLLAAFVDVPEDAVAMLEAAGKPVILIERPRPAGKPGCVSLDHAVGARHAASAFLEMGRRRIGYVGPCSGDHAGNVRFSNATAVLSAAGLALEAEHEETYDMTEAGEKTAALLDRVPDLDALLFGSDIQAIGGLHVLRRRGLDVPGRIAVIGFDDSESARTFTPRLSSVRQPFEEAGYKAAEMLGKVLAGESSALANIVLPEKLILRQSCLAGFDGDLVFQPGLEMLAKF